MVDISQYCHNQMEFGKAVKDSRVFTMVNRAQYLVWAGAPNPMNDRPASTRRSVNVMEGGGAYTRHSRSQSAAADLGIPYLAEAARKTSLPDEGQPAFLLDLGAADGANSVAPMSAAIDVLRVRWPTLPVVIVHAELPQSDFTTLFQLIADPKRSYRRDRVNVFGLAAGSSYLQPLIPDGVASLAWSSIAVHWLADVPTHPTDEIWPPAIVGAAREPWREQAAREWRMFLQVVTNQLRPGGRLVVVTGFADGDGKTGGETLMDTILHASRDSLAKEELSALLVPVWFRTWEEFTTPIDDLAGVSLEHEAREVLTDPVGAAYDDHHDAARFGREQSGFLRAAFGPSLVSQLSKDRRRPALDAIFDRVSSLIAEDPAMGRVAWNHGVLVIRRD